MFWANILGIAVLVAVLSFAMMVSVYIGEAVYKDGIKAGIALGEGRIPRCWMDNEEGASED